MVERRDESSNHYETNKEAMTSSPSPFNLMASGFATDSGRGRVGEKGGDDGEFPSLSHESDERGRPMSRHKTPQKSLGGEGGHLWYKSPPTIAV